MSMNRLRKTVISVYVAMLGDSIELLCERKSFTEITYD